MAMAAAAADAEPTSLWDAACRGAINWMVWNLERNVDIKIDAVRGRIAGEPSAGGDAAPPHSGRRQPPSFRRPLTSAGRLCSELH